MAISSHDSALQFISNLHRPLQSNPAIESGSQQMLHLEQLPLRCIGYLSETKLVGAGFDGEVCFESFC